MNPSFRRGAKPHNSVAVGQGAKAHRQDSAAVGAYTASGNTLNRQVYIAGGSANAEVSLGPAR
ncbi:hypothetical protein P0D75_08950 [Paraburkholderia sediminicola]|uniref:hypothetical protein n=1 Tax=Paraburkholderia sediminicola TaxID=458836 RepID=UPI0038B9100A